MSKTSRPSPLARIRADVLGMHAYTVAPSEGYLKLDAMESPYRLSDDLSPALRAQLMERLAAAPVHRYPGELAQALALKLHRWLGLPQDYGVLLGNGSDELISIVTSAVAKPGAVALAPEPGFVMYRHYAQFAQMAYHGVDLRAQDFALDVPRMHAALAQHDPAVLWLASPNNPTGNLFEPQAVRELIAAAPGLVVLDEAYQAFAGHSWLPELLDQRWPQVLLLRTLSKIGFAGARFGYLVGPRELLTQFDKLRSPYNVNTLSLTLIDFALDHAEVWAQQANNIVRERESLAQALAACPDTQVFPSAANFLLVRCDSGATRIAQALHANKVLVKNVSTMHPHLHNCLRITVSTAAENRQFLDAYLRALDRLP